MEFGGSDDGGEGSSIYSSLRICVIGGGLSGLGVAIALQRIGYRNVQVYERDTTFGDRRQGFGLTLTNNPKGPLAYLGLLDDCIKLDCPSDCHYIFKPSGEVMGYYGRHFLPHKEREAKKQRRDDGACDDTINSCGGNRGNLRIPRQLLRQMLLDKLLPGTVKWGYKLDDYQEYKDRIQVHFSRCDCSSSSGSSSSVAEVIETDLLIGADGIRSIVRKLRDRHYDYGDESSVPRTPSRQQQLYIQPLKYLGIGVILGLTTTRHPLLEKRGFYILDGTHRLFTMPFTNELTMWQLSFSEPDECEAQLLKSMKPQELVHIALRRTQKWMKPVVDMILATPLDEVWGTALYDRDTMRVFSKQHPGSLKGLSVPRYESCVTVLGDSCHPQSMFKGQGANQSLEDSPLLAKILSQKGLSRTNLGARLRVFEREMVSRVGPKVLGSREAARRLHAGDVMGDVFGFEGLDETASALLQLELQRLNITALCGERLDDKIRECVERIRQS